MSAILVYSSKHCPYCTRAKMLLNAKGAHYQEIFVDSDPEQLRKMIDKTGRRTVPQIIIENQPIGGFDDLAALEHAGKLDTLLKTTLPLGDTR